MPDPPKDKQLPVSSDLWRAVTALMLPDDEHREDVLRRHLDFDVEAVLRQLDDLDRLTRNTETYQERLGDVKDTE